MEDTLTTENEDSQVEVSNEPTTDEESHVEESTTETSYDEAWDKLDVNDMEAVDSVLGNEEEVQEASEEPAEMTEEEEAKKAFMEAAPTLKFKGKDIPIEDPDEIIALAQKGFKLETEMSKIKPQKKALSIIDGVPLEVLQAVADLQSGKQDALDYLRDHYGVETSKESDDFFSEYNDEPKKEDSTYKPEVKVENPIEEYWNEFAKDNTVEAAKISEVYTDLDPSFQSELYKPEVFPAFVESVRTGEFDKVYPLAVKERVLNPALSWMDAYGAAVQKVGLPTQEKTEPPKSAQIPATKAPRTVKETDAAAAIWEDDEAFTRMSQEIFAQG